MPQGLRTELGYNFGSYFKLGFIYGAFDTWSTYHEKGKIGLLCGVHFPVPDASVTSYLFIAHGGSPEILGAAESYTMGGLGALIHLTDVTSLRPEIFFTYTSRFISGHSGWLGYVDVIQEDNLLVGVNLLIELDLRNL